jgi:hypothetical protein
MTVRYLKLGWLFSLRCSFLAALLYFAAALLTRWIRINRFKFAGEGKHESPRDSFICGWPLRDRGSLLCGYDGCGSGSDGVAGGQP